MRVVIFFFLALIASHDGAPAWAQASIRVSTSVENAREPARILAMQPGTQSYVAELNGRWGTLQVPLADTRSWSSLKGIARSPCGSGRSMCPPAPQKQSTSHRAFG